MLIDEVIVKIKAGNGGDGFVAFNKNLMELGPAGGNGGMGGSVYVEGSSDLTLLNQFRFKKEIVAQDGGNGRMQFIDGSRGEDVVVRVPVGTVLHNLDTSEDIEVLQIGEKICIARCGHGGKGNFLFRSSTNTTPKEAQPGKPGESFTFRFELKYIADVGLIGLPNVGKSSLLNEITNAKTKVANYHFTTLEPNLGVYYDLILADLPGLIEGASEGKGLGIKFLKHVERTKVLFHLVSAQSENVVGDYKAVRDELKKYNKELMKKKEYVFISKSDEVSVDEISKKIKEFKKRKITATPLSVLSEDSIKNVKHILEEVQREKTKNTI
ncbi:MAG: GTPase ObgE [Candidatus Paceibacterota bacterium]